MIAGIEEVKKMCVEIFKKLSHAHFRIKDMHVELYLIHAALACNDTVSDAYVRKLLFMGQDIIKELEL